jgi:hypothetical protein
MSQIRYLHLGRIQRLFQTGTEYPSLQALYLLEFETELTQQRDQNPPTLPAQAQYHKPPDMGGYRIQTLSV